MKLKGIGIRDNKTGYATVYLPEIHSLVKTTIEQKEKVKYGYELNSPYSQAFIDDVKMTLENTFEELERRSLMTRPNLGFCVITNECNMGCSFCFADKNSIYGDTFNIEWIDKITSILPINEHSITNISGGEPLLFFDKVKLLQEKLGRIRIYSNGSMLNDEIAEWAINTKTKFHIALDYTIDGFEGHDSAGVRKMIDDLCLKHSELKNLIEIAITYPSDKIDKFNDYRSKQKASFEKDLEHEINYIGADTSYLTPEVFNSELDRVENGEILLDDSIFNRQVRYVDRTIKNYINVESCSPNITLNFNGDVTSCFVNGSNVTHDLYNRCVISSIDDFSLESYYDYAMKTKRRGLCKRDCPAKFFCGNICWANIDYNSFNCDITKNSLFHVLYLELNHSDIDLTNEINFTRAEHLWDY